MWRCITAVCLQVDQKVHAAGNHGKYIIKGLLKITSSHIHHKVVISQNLCKTDTYYGPLMDSHIQPMEQLQF